MDGEFGMGKLLKSYFFWTYSRGSLHYDVMVTLILAFIFVTPHLWNYGDKPWASEHLRHAIAVIANENNQVVVLVSAADVNLDLHTKAKDSWVRKQLREAITPVMSDSIEIDNWQTVIGTDGQPSWKVWAHR